MTKTYTDTDINMCINNNKNRQYSLLRTPTTKTDIKKSKLSNSVKSSYRVRNKKSTNINNKMFQTPPINKKWVSKNLTNSCPTSNISSENEFIDIRYKENDNNNSNKNKSLHFDEILSFLTKTQTNIEGDFLILKKILEEKIEHERMLASIISEKPSDIAILLVGGNINQLNEKIYKMENIISAIEELKLIFSSQQNSFFKIMDKLQSTKGKLDEIMDSLNKRALRISEGFFEANKKEQIRRRCQAIGLELEIEYLNEYEDQCFMLKNEIAQMIPELQMVNYQITEKIKGFVRTYIDLQAKILLGINNERIKGVINIVRVRHSHHFGKDGVPQFCSNKE